MAYMMPGRRDAVDAMPRRFDAVDVASESLRVARESRSSFDAWRLDLSHAIDATHKHATQAAA